MHQFHAQLTRRWKIYWPDQISQTIASKCCRIIDRPHIDPISKSTVPRNLVEMKLSAFLQPNIDAVIQSKCIQILVDFHDRKLTDLVHREHRDWMSISQPLQSRKTRLFHRNSTNDRAKLVADIQIGKPTATSLLYFFTFSFYGFHFTRYNSTTTKKS